MAMTVIWTGMTALSLFCALALGNQGQLAAAALELSLIHISEPTRRS